MKSVTKKKDPNANILLDPLVSIRKQAAYEGTNAVYDMQCSSGHRKTTNHLLQKCTSICSIYDHVPNRIVGDWVLMLQKAQTVLEPM
ncbi:hypothetical protein AgCh_037692 [Apium graveolens]